MKIYTDEGWITFEELAQKIGAKIQESKPEKLKTVIP